MAQTDPIDPKSLRVESGETDYPDEFKSVVAGRRKRKLGDLFGLANYGVNLTDLEPGSASALNHYHSKQDEFIYVLKGVATLKLGTDTFEVSEGECVGFKAGTGVGHQLLNRSESVVTYLEIGDRRPGDTVTYPNDDLRADLTAEGTWAFTRKDGRPY